MTDPVTRAPPPAYVPPVARAAVPAVTVPAPGGGPDPHAAGEPLPEKRARLALDVARSDDGVFVYTLRDPATDVVLAVIPRGDVVPHRNGRNVDRRV